MTVPLATEVKRLVTEGLPDWIAEQPELRHRLWETLVTSATLSAGLSPVEGMGEIPRQPLRQALGRLPKKMTYEEFLAWADEDTLAEWVDGEVVMYSPASNRHQDIADFMVSVLRPLVEARQLGIVRSAPFQMKLEHGREPDLLFVANEHLDRLKETYLDGPADLVVEIVSPESAGRDRGEKFYEYEQAGISEYWLIDPHTKRAEFYQLTAAGQYQLVLPDAEGVYRSAALPDLWLRVEWLWREPLPPVLDVVRELGLI